MSLSVFYGFDLTQAPPASLLAYQLHRPAVAARRAFDAKLAAGTNPTPDEVYRMVLLETSDEEAAQAAGTDWMAQLLRADARAG